MSIGLAADPIRIRTGQLTMQLGRFTDSIYPQRCLVHNFHFLCTPNPCAYALSWRQRGRQASGLYMYRQASHQKLLTLPIRLMHIFHVSRDMQTLFPCTPRYCNMP